MIMELILDLNRLKFDIKKHDGKNDEMVFQFPPDEPTNGTSIINSAFINCDDSISYFIDPEYPSISAALMLFHTLIQQKKGQLNILDTDIVNRIADFDRDLVLNGIKKSE